MDYSHLYFPGFREKAFTMSYDDGVSQDVRLVELMNKNGVKGTFNLNSACFGRKRQNGYRLTVEEAKALYIPAGHEVALHGALHMTLTQVDTATGINDVVSDRRALEEIFGGIIVGMAYANGAYNDEVVDYLKKIGVAYARTTKATNGFAIPTDWLRLQPTCRHMAENLFELLDEFLAPPKRTFLRTGPRLFYLWGHSYEFDDNNDWDRIEKFLEKIGNREEIYYATNIEIYRYVKAYEALTFGIDFKSVYNPTVLDVYLDVWGKQVIAKAGEVTVIE